MSADTFVLTPALWAVWYTACFLVFVFSSQSLETSVALSIIKDDERGKTAAKDGIKIVETALHVIVICEIVVFVVFSLFEVWSKREKVVRCGTKLSGCLGKTCPCLLRGIRRCCPRRCCFGALHGRRRTRTRVSSASPSSSSSPRTASFPSSSPPSSRVSAGVEMTSCETKGEEGEGTLTATGDSGGLQPAAAVAAAAGGGDGVSGMDTVTNPLYGGLRMARTMTQEARDAAHDALGGVQQNALPGSVVANLSLPCQRASISLDVNPTAGVPEPTAATTASPTTTTTAAPAIVSERNQKEEVDFSEATVSSIGDSIGVSHESFSGSNDDDSAIVMNL